MNVYSAVRYYFFCNTTQLIDFAGVLKLIDGCLTYKSTQKESFVMGTICSARGARRGALMCSKLEMHLKAPISKWLSHVYVN